MGFIKNLIFLHKFIKENEIDVVHCHHRIAALYMGFLNLLWKHPYVYTLHIAPVPSDIVHRFFTFCGYRTIAISNEVRDFLIDKLKIQKDKIDLVLNGVDETQLSPLTIQEKIACRSKFGIPSNKIVVSIHARISAIKNQISVVKAVAELTLEERNNLVVLCSGSNSGSAYNEVEETVRKLSLENNFVFCGWAGAREVIGCSDYMMLPSTSEGFPLNCIESMFLRVPVVRTKTGGYENIQPFCIGMENPSVSCIRKYLRMISSRESFLSERVNIAEQFVNENCTLTQMTNNIVKVYLSVVRKNENRNEA